ncbi:MAG: SagB/ThcOx family dehydrogenase [Tannerellaceae bacterium]|nr:SagB/ThcOx family dehydrogenase [Tannerellaceae bacterium]
MKQRLITGLIFLLLIAAKMEAQNPIKLVQPDKTRGKSVMAAMNVRKSTRDFNSRMLSDQDLSDLLWAAWGINREDGRRTAPSALNTQDVDLYVVMQQGTYVYDGKNHSLVLVTTGDHRAAVAGSQDFAKEAPVLLVMVSDLSRFGGTITEHTKIMAAVNVGTISQNINLFCAATDLVTVPRAFMDTEALKKIFKLTDQQFLILNNPVGYPKN